MPGGRRALISAVQYSIKTKRFAYSRPYTVQATGHSKSLSLSSHQKLLMHRQWYESERDTLRSVEDRLTVWKRCPVVTSLSHGALDTIRCCRRLFSPWPFGPSPSQGHTGNTSTSTDTRNQRLLVAPGPCFPSTLFQTVYTYLNLTRIYLCAQLFSQVPYVCESSPQLEMTAERPRMPVENARAFPTCAPMM